MKNKKSLLIILLFVVAIIVLIVTIFANKDDKRKNDISIVYDYGAFYTVNSCLYRFTTYISSNDSKSVLLTLSNNYKKENKITEANVLEHFSDVPSDSTFVSKKMYYEKIDDNITKYYVYGYFGEDILDDYYESNKDLKNVYYIVYLDSSKKIFSVEPYDGKVFGG